MPRWVSGLDGVVSIARKQWCKVVWHSCKSKLSNEGIEVCKHTAVHHLVLGLPLGVLWGQSCMTSAKASATSQQCPVGIKWLKTVATWWRNMVIFPSIEGIIYLLVKKEGGGWRRHGRLGLDSFRNAHIYTFSAIHMAGEALCWLDLTTFRIP